MQHDGIVENMRFSLITMNYLSDIRANTPIIGQLQVKYMINVAEL